MSAISIASDSGNEWPAEGVERVLHCPACGGARRQLSHEGLTDEVFRCAPGRWDLQRCTDCGSGYLDPRPTPATIGLAYAKYYTHAAAGGVDYATASWWRRFRMAQRNSYLNAKYGYALKPAAGYPLTLGRARRQRFDSFAGYLRFPGRGARILDVGCGNGRFLWQMRSLGWDVCGVEPDPQSAVRAREAGLDVRTGMLQEQAFANESFDAVTMFHVIEHLHEPADMLRRCWKLLKPHGRITVVTPNFDSCGHRYYGAHWRGIETPRHLVIFTDSSLRRMLENCGFKVSRPAGVSLQAHGFFKSSLVLKHGGDPTVRHPRLSLFERLQLRWLAAQANRATLRNPACGEEVILLGEKPA